MNHCLHLAVQSYSFRKGSWKNSSHPSFLSYTHFKTAYSFLPNHCSSFWVLKKNSSLHAFSCKQEAKSSCAYWEEVTSLPCRKYNYSIIRSSRCSIGLVCPVSSFFSKIRVSLDKNETYRCTKEHKVIVITKWKQSLSVEHFLSSGKPGRRKGALGIANSPKLKEDAALVSLCGSASVVQA